MGCSKGYELYLNYSKIIKLLEKKERTKKEFLKLTDCTDHMLEKILPQLKENKVITVRKEHLLSDKRKFNIYKINPKKKEWVTSFHN